jgi:hypothetical protein
MNYRGDRAPAELVVHTRTMAAHSFIIVGAWLQRVDVSAVAYVRADPALTRYQLLEAGGSEAIGI